MASAPTFSPDDAAGACRGLLGTADAQVREPSPMSANVPHRRRARSTCFVDTERGTVVVTRRADSRIGAIEARGLAELFRRGAPVPRPLAFDGVWLIQDAVEGTRLSQALATAPRSNGEDLLGAALDAVGHCRQAGAAADLGRRVPPVPDAEFLLPGLAALGKAFRRPPPSLSEAAKRCLAHTPRHHFVKGDTRPANAIVTPKGAIVWVDWEHACFGHAVTDLDWLLGDEWVPDWPEIEERLIGPRLDQMAPSLAAQGGAGYFWLYGTLHALMRLATILALRGGGPWWDPQVCLEHDLRGVTAECAGRICRRAARWAARSELSANLVPWIGEIGAAL